MSRSKYENTTLSKHHSKQHIITALSELNAHLDQLADSILPKQPYLLSVPSDVPYRHSSRFVNTWYIGTPFHKREEQVQYVSFLPHQGEHESLLRVVGGWSDDQGNVLEEEPSPRTVYTSGRNTPLDQSQRKKISLKDYKTKDKVSQEGDQELFDKPAVAIPQSPPVKEEIPTDRNVKVEEAKQQPQRPMDIPVPQLGAEKETAMSLDGASSPISPSNRQEKEGSPRPVKRRKLTPPSDERKATPSASPEGRREREPSLKKLPSLLSPTLPTPARERGLPQLLSPVLPPTLVKAIATPPPSIAADVDNSHHRSESVRSILANAISDNSPQPSVKNGPSTGSLGGSRNRSDSQHSVRSNASGPGGNQTIAKTVAKASLRADTPLLSTSRSPGPRQRHTIILKYGKKNRKRVEALLKFAARPKKPIVRPEVSVQNTNADLKPKATADNPARTDKKHQREASPEQLSKKPKPTPSSAEAKHPNTPSIPHHKDNIAPGSPFASGMKSVQSTPKKELKSSAMRRVESTDGGDPSTPGGKGRGSTPLSVDRFSTTLKMSPGPTSAPAARDEDRQAWNKLNTKYFSLGRTIKHEGTSLGPSPAAEANDKDSAKSVILLIEALLCFMINLAALSHGRPNTDPGWSTIIPYHIFVFRASRKFPHLHGLVIQLGAVCRQLIHKYDMDRLARDPLPDEHCSSAPTPGSDGNTKTNEDGERYKKKYIEFRDSLVRNARELQTAWLDGSRYLSPDALEHSYTKTWAKRAKDSSHRGLEKPSPGNISKDFYLPMDATTTAFEAVRFTLSLLDEWTENEGVDWRTRIDL